MSVLAHAVEELTQLSELLSDAVLTVRDLRVELSDGAAVVEGADLRLVAGEILGLVGESGSGKTTLATALLAHARRGAQIVGGTVSIGGQDLLQLEGEALRAARGALIGYIPQDPGMALNPALRIGHLLRETLATHEPRLPASEVQQRLQQTLADVSLPGDTEFLKRYPHQLSGGQQQRVLLALAFILRPRVVVLDEPTTALDVTTQAHFLRALRELCKRQGVAAVYVSHDLAVVKELADRVMVLYAGRVVESAPTATLFSQPAHPYTRGLLASIPDVAERRVLSAIEGQASAPGNRPVGCAFASRCSRRQLDCSQAAVPLLPRDLRHSVACLHPQIGALNVPLLAAPGVVEDRSALLEVRAVNLHYAKRPVLKNVSLSLLQGECLALVGESGSGKTSLSRSLVGLAAQVQGELFHQGQRLAWPTVQRSAEQQRLIQYIFQNPFQALNPRLTVGQSLATPLRHFFGLKGQALQARIEQALVRVALPASAAKAYPASLSGGERQRVAIARALACEPQVLICDEITSALDVSMQAAILGLLRDLQAQGLSILFVTHDLAVVRSLADRVAVLKDGEIVELGSLSQVFEQPQHSYTRQLLEHAVSLA